MTSPDITVITLSFQQFVSLIVTIVGAAVGIVIWVYKQKDNLEKKIKDDIGKRDIEEQITTLYRKIDVIETRVNCIKENLDKVEGRVKFIEQYNLDTAPERAKRVRKELRRRQNKNE
jgi:hypothetical protein